MSEVTASIDIDAPPERVWKVVMDPERLGEWVTIHRKVDKISDRPLKRGSELEQKLCLRGATFKVAWTVVDLEEGRQAVWEGRGPARSKARTEYRVEPDGNGGTRFGYDNEFKAPLGPLGSIASRALVGGLPQREATKSLRQLKQLIEK